MLYRTSVHFRIIVRVLIATFIVAMVFAGIWLHGSAILSCAVLTGLTVSAMFPDRRGARVLMVSGFCFVLFAKDMAPNDAIRFSAWVVALVAFVFGLFVRLTAAHCDRLRSRDPTM